MLAHRSPGEESGEEGWGVGIEMTILTGYEETRERGGLSRSLARTLTGCFPRHLTWSTCLLAEVCIVFVFLGVNILLDGPQENIKLSEFGTSEIMKVGSRS